MRVRGVKVGCSIGSRCIPSLGQIRDCSGQLLQKSVSALRRAHVSNSLQCASWLGISQYIHIPFSAIFRRFRPPSRTRGAVNACWSR